MLTTVKEGLVQVTPAPKFDGQPDSFLSSAPTAELVGRLARLPSKEALPDLIDAAEKLTAAMAEVQYRIAVLGESEKLFRSELILAVQVNPALIDGKVTDKTTEAFYRSQSVFVELNMLLAKYRRTAMILRGRADLVDCLLRVTTPATDQGAFDATAEGSSD